jgi:putative ABC transport system permease protein
MGLSHRRRCRRAAKYAAKTEMAAQYTARLSGSTGVKRERGWAYVGVFKCAFVEMVRKPIRSGILCVVFIFVFVGDIYGFSLLSTADAARNNVFSQIGTKITLAQNYDYQGDDSADRGLITAEIIDRIQRGSDHILGTNQSLANFATPIDFVNCHEYSGVNPNENNDAFSDYDLTKDGVVIDGNSRIDMVSEFRTGLSNVIEGSYPTSEQTGVLIERRLAEINNLTVGDVVELESRLFETSSQLVVVGIYATAARFELTENNSMGEAIYAHSPYNRIFADLDSAASLFNASIAELQLDIYIDNPNNIDAVGRLIRNMDFNWDELQLINTTEETYQQQARQVDVLHNTSRLILFYVSAFGIVIMLLVLGIWVKDHDYQLGLLIALGADKTRGVAQYVLTTSYLIVVGLAASAVISLITLAQMASLFLDPEGYQSIAIASFHSGKELEVVLGSAGFSVFTYVFVCGIAFALLLISCVHIVRIYVSYKPRQLLVKK